MHISAIWDVLNEGNETLPTPSNLKVLFETKDALETIAHYVQQPFYEETLYFRKIQIAFASDHIEKLYKVAARVYDEDTTISQTKKDLLQKILFQLDAIWEDLRIEKERLEKLPPEKEPVHISDELKTFDSSAS